MTLNRLYIKNLRNIVEADIRPCAQVNIFFGENGSGKTTVLEAINILALGRSFRSHKHKHLIQFGHDALTVFGKVTADDQAEVPIGVSRFLNGEASLKANGTVISSAAELAAFLPLQVINSDTFSLLEGSPKVRRQFMDWLVFHVEHSFFPLWRSLQRSLKHRNALLRHDRMTPLDLAAWDHEIAGLTEKIHQLRQLSFSKYEEVFRRICSEFLEVKGIDIQYYCGWNLNREYSEILAENIDRDKRLGYTQFGSHKADLKITISGQDAADVLSRGQQKLLVCALRIAQGVAFTSATGRNSIFLVDDLPAELDNKHRRQFAEWLAKLGTQVFVTGVERDSLLSSWENIPDTHLKMFHVEHGNVIEQ